MGTNYPPSAPNVAVSTNESVALQETLAKLSEAIVNLSTSTQDFNTSQSAMRAIQERAERNEISVGESKSLMQQMTTGAAPSTELSQAMRALNENVGALRDLQQQLTQQQMYASKNAPQEVMSRADNTAQMDMLMHEMSKFTTIAHTASAAQYGQAQFAADSFQAARQYQDIQLNPSSFSDQDVADARQQQQDRYDNTQLAATNFVVSKSLGVRSGGMASSEFAEALPMMNDFAASSGKTVDQVGELLRKMSDVGRISADVRSGSFSDIYSGLSQLEKLMHKTSSLGHIASRVTSENRMNNLSYSSDLTEDSNSLAKSTSGALDPVMAVIGGQRGISERLAQSLGTYYKDSLGYLQSLGEGDVDNGLDKFDEDFSEGDDIAESYIESKYRRSLQAGSTSEYNKAAAITERIKMLRDMGMSESEAELATFRGDTKAVLAYRKARQAARANNRRYGEDLGTAMMYKDASGGAKELDNSLDTTVDFSQGISDSSIVNMANAAYNYRVAAPLKSAAARGVDILGDFRNKFETKTIDGITGEGVNVDAADYSFGKMGLFDKETGLAYNITSGTETAELDGDEKEKIQSISKFAAISSALNTEHGVKATLTALHRMTAHKKTTEGDLKNLIQSVYQYHVGKMSLLSNDMDTNNLREMLEFIRETSLESFAEELPKFLNASHPILPALAKATGITTAGLQFQGDTKKSRETFVENAIFAAVAPNAKSIEEANEQAGINKYLGKEALDWFTDTNTGLAIDAIGIGTAAIGAVAGGVAAYGAGAGLMSGIGAVAMGTVGAGAIAGSAIGIAVAATGIGAAVLVGGMLAVWGAGKLKDYWDVTAGDVLDKEGLQNFADSNESALTKEKKAIALTMNSAFFAIFGSSTKAMEGTLKTVFAAYKMAADAEKASVKSGTRLGDQEVKKKVTVPQDKINAIVDQIMEGAELNISGENNAKIRNSVRYVLSVLNSKDSSMGEIVRSASDGDLQKLVANILQYVEENNENNLLKDDEIVNTFSQLEKNITNGSLSGESAAALTLNLSGSKKASVMEQHLQNIQLGLKRATYEDAEHGSAERKDAVDASESATKKLMEYGAGARTGTLELSDTEIQRLAEASGTNESAIKAMLRKINDPHLSADARKGVASGFVSSMDSAFNAINEEANQREEMVSQLVMHSIRTLKNSMDSGDTDVAWLKEFLTD